MKRGEGDGGTGMEGDSNWSKKKKPLKKPSLIRVKHVFVTFTDWLILPVSARIHKFLICEKVDHNYKSDCSRMVINIEKHWLSVYHKKTQRDRWQKVLDDFYIMLEAKKFIA